MTQTQVEARIRTYAWSDPRIHAGLLGRRSGDEVMTAFASGELPPPPIMKTLDFENFSYVDGQVTFTLRPQEFHYNPLGTVHGGVIATLLDSAAGCAVHSMLPAGYGYTSIDLNTKFLSPVTVDSGLLTCAGSVIKRGRATALAEARLTDEAGRLVAHATSTCMIFDLPAPRAGDPSR